MPKLNRLELDPVTQAQLDTRWQTLTRAEPGRTWRQQPAPPFPATWPLARPGQLCYYRYATGFDPHLADGEHVAGPWVRLEVRLPAQVVQVEFLGAQLAYLGIQGVRPLGQVEAKLWDEAEHLEAHWEALSQAPNLETPPAQLIRRFYKFWASSHGVILAALQPLHPAFVQWFSADTD